MLKYVVAEQFFYVSFVVSKENFRFPDMAKMIQIGHGHNFIGVSFASNLSCSSEI